MMAVTAPCLPQPPHDLAVSLLSQQRPAISVCGGCLVTGIPTATVSPYWRLPM